MTLQKFVGTKLLITPHSPLPKTRNAQDGLLPPPSVGRYTPPRRVSPRRRHQCRRQAPGIYGHGRGKLGDIVPDAPTATPTTAGPKTQHSPGSATAVPREREVYAIGIFALMGRDPRLDERSELSPTRRGTPLLYKYLNSLVPYGYDINSISTRKLHRGRNGFSLIN